MGEVGAEAGIVTFAHSGLARIRRPVRPQHGVSLPPDDKTRGVPGSVDIGLVLGPVAELTRLGLAIGPEVVGLGRGRFMHLV